jgi:phospholipid transport system substrate-binding protein
VAYSAQQVLGRHWRTATPEQRTRFTAALYQSLLKTYGKALLDFTSDQMKVLPPQGAADAARATVRTQVRTSNGTNIAVNYTLRKVDGGQWKVWDVVIEGISYVKSFRDDFGSEIDQKGLESLLARLEKGQL